MKKFIFLISALLLLLINTSTASSKMKIILTTQNWPPYQVYENEILTGSAVQVVKCVLRKMEQPYEIKVFPWKRAQRMVERGEAHGFFSASQNNIRNQYAKISYSIASQKWNWYLLKENPMNPADESFKKKASVTAMFGSNMLLWLKKNGYKILGHTRDTELLIKLLVHKRVDAILVNELVAKKVLEKNKINPDKFNVFLNMNKPLCVYWSKTFLSENPAFHNQFNKMIEECRNELPLQK
ncbi:MAG: transporter substrate-binding domain-containing protein [Desulfobacterales bacterium]|nr:transporter substrate-binding domain-containing protein [Desulfobacterales bacterium]MCP4163937.1 transporter substrate-binding domain-containing protein [Deltaproteobacteria bacterium]